MDTRSWAFFILGPLEIGLDGLAFRVLGIGHPAREQAFARRASRAPGVVVGFRRRTIASRSDYGSSVYDFPVVRYTPSQTLQTLSEGGEIEFESPAATRPRVVREGQPVTVLYDPADPRRARIASGCLRYALPIVFIVLGLSLAAFAAIFILFASFLIAQIPAA